MIRLYFANCNFISCLASTLRNCSHVSQSIAGCTYKTLRYQICQSNNNFADLGKSQANTSCNPCIYMASVKVWKTAHMVPPSAHARLKNKSHECNALLLCVVNFRHVTRPSQVLLPIKRAFVQRTLRKQNAPNNVKDVHIKSTNPMAFQSGFSKT